MVVSAIFNNLFENALECCKVVFRDTALTISFKLIDDTAELFIDLAPLFCENEIVPASILF